VGGGIFLWEEGEQGVRPLGRREVSSRVSNAPSAYVFETFWRTEVIGGHQKKPCFIGV